MSDSSKGDLEPGGSGGISLTPKSIAAIVIAVAALLFVFSNTADVTLKFLWLEVSAPGWMMLLALFAGGFAVGFFLGRNRYKRK